MSANGKHVADDWETEILICPDEACGQMLKGKSALGRPPCSGPIHKRTGHYPRMDRLVVVIKERV